MINTKILPHTVLGQQLCGGAGSRLGTRLHPESVEKSRWCPPVQMPHQDLMPDTLHDAALPIYPGLGLVKYQKGLPVLKPL